MISSLNGKILLKQKNFVIVETSGIGYKVFVPDNTLLDSKINSEQTFFTHHHIREDVDDLYGFLKYDELEFFEMLLKVSGIGPKVALAILGIGDLERIKKAIIENDSSVFLTVSGVGRKAATKIIVELKNKISGLEADLGSLLLDNNEVAGALQNLGYKNEQILKTIQKMPSDIAGTKDQIRWALKNIQ